MTKKDDAYDVEWALNIARLWRAGKMIGGDEDMVRNALLDEIEQLRAERDRLQTYNAAQGGLLLTVQAEATRLRAALAGMIEGVRSIEVSGDDWQEHIGDRLARAYKAVGPGLLPQEIAALEGAPVEPSAVLGQSPSQPADVARVIKEAAKHIEDILPRPGPYAPEFFALLELADKLKAQEVGEPRECQCASYCMLAAGAKYDPPIKCRGLTGERRGVQQAIGACQHDFGPNPDPDGTPCRKGCGGIYQL